MLIFLKNRCLILTSILVISFAAFFPFSKILTFSSKYNSNYIKLPEKISFEANLQPNSHLKDAIYIAHKKIRGPETVVFSQNGSLYSGLLNGQVVRFDLETDEIFVIAHTGDEADSEICRNLLNLIDNHGINIHANKSCGRPLGLRFKSDDDDILYVADAYFGIFKFNIKRGTKEKILSSTDNRFKNLPLMINDLDIEGDLIYFIDSSDVREVNEAVDEAFEAQPRGRLYSFNERTNELILLTSGLFFPNGLQLTPNKEEILINECSASRIIKYYLKGKKKGIKEIFANLPGLGDTIRLTSNNTLLAPISMVRQPGKLSIFDWFSTYPKIRNILGSIINLRYILLNLNILPKYGLLLEYDLNGTIIKSWHDPTGKRITSTASAVINGDKLYIGSYYTDFVAVVNY